MEVFSWVLLDKNLKNLMYNNSGNVYFKTKKAFEIRNRIEQY